MYIFIAALVLFATTFYYRERIVSNIKSLLATYEQFKKFYNIIKGNGSGTIETTFTTNATGESANLIYSRLGSKYILNVPYNRKYVATMAQFEVYLILKDADPIKITQQPGIPYMVSAKDLGGVIIRIVNHENDTRYDYSENIIPLYGTEAM